MVSAWALHAGDRIAVAEPGDGTFAAVITEIRDTPVPFGAEHELDWEAADHHCSGCLHYSPADLVNRLWANRKAVAA
jgi:hypothetical protein